MKRYLILVLTVAALVGVVLLRRRDGGGVSPSQISEPHPAANSGDHSNAVSPESQNADIGMSETVRTEAERQYIATRNEEIRRSNEAANVPVWLYGLVVDQDTNPLPNVTVNLAVVEEYADPPPATGLRRNVTRMQKKTGADGRFEVNGLKGKYVGVEALTKEGFEQEYPGQLCGTYGAQITSFQSPAVLTMWGTNLHEPLVAGKKNFVIIPDGRHYGIDLVKGTIAEGEEGDLVAWIKRPEKVTWGQRYDWSCELAAPVGGLLESQSPTMFIAPEVGYTNVFAYQEDANFDGGGPMTSEKLFYVRPRKGHIYGRIVVRFYADYFGKQPAMIQLSYVVNPSGSRLLR
jgi:hypothetical protein